MSGRVSRNNLLNGFGFGPVAGVARQPDADLDGRVAASLRPAPEACGPRVR